MKEESPVQKLQNQLEAANRRNDQLHKEWQQMYRVQQLLVAAGLVTEEKIRQAEELARI